MGANLSQQKEHSEERRVKRSPTLSTILGKSSLRFQPQNLFGIGKRSPHPPATPTTQYAPALPIPTEPLVDGRTASPEPPVDAPQMTSDTAVDVSDCADLVSSPQQKY